MWPYAAAEGESLSFVFRQPGSQVSSIDIRNLPRRVVHQKRRRVVHPKRKRVVHQRRRSYSPQSCRTDNWTCLRSSTRYNRSRDVEIGAATFLVTPGMETESSKSVRLPKTKRIKCQAEGVEFYRVIDCI